MSEASCQPLRPCARDSGGGGGRKNLGNWFQCQCTQCSVHTISNAHNVQCAHSHYVAVSNKSVALLWPKNLDINRTTLEMGQRTSGKFGSAKTELAHRQYQSTSQQCYEQAKHVKSFNEVGYRKYKGRVHKKKTEKVWSFAKPGGGGSRRVVKCQTSILGS